MQVTRAEQRERSMLIDFLFTADELVEGEFADQYWQVEAKGVHASMIRFNFSAPLAYETDDPLIWDVADTQSNLYFKGQFRDPYQIVYEFVRINEHLYGNYKAFQFPDQGWMSILPRQFSNGFVCDGPRKLLQVYGEVLKKHGLEYQIVGAYQPTYWKPGEGEVPVGEPHLLLLGPSYLVADEFLFTQRETPDAPATST